MLYVDVDVELATAVCGCVAGLSSFEACARECRRCVVRVSGVQTSELSDDHLDATGGG